MVRKLPAPAVNNPFSWRIQWTWPLVIKTVLGAIFIFPIRLVMFIVSLVFLIPICYVVGYGWTPGRGNHLKPWQQWLAVNVAVHINRVFLFWVGHAWIDYKGKKASIHDAPISVLAPHCTLSDGNLLAAVAFGSPVSRVANYENKLFRPLLVATEPIIVNRGNKESRHAVVDEIKARLSSPGRWTSVVFFPEGTCGNSSGLLAFKGGPFYPGCPVQPVAVHNLCPHRFGVWTFNSYNLAQGLFFTMCQLNNPICVEYLPVYHPSEEEKENPFLFASNVQAVMARSLGVPATDFSFEDANLMIKGMKKGLPEDAALVEFHLLREMTGMNFAEMSDQLDRFIAMDTNKDGFVSLEDMQEFFCWPAEAAVERFFAEYDTSSRQRITFREFLLGLADLARAVPRAEVVCQEAYQILSSSSSSMTAQSIEHGFSARGVDCSEQQARDLFERVNTGLESSLDEGGFIKFISANPEYQVFLQWLLHGQESFPKMAQFPDDEPDKRPSFTD